MAPAGQTTRPTSDRVREALFNALGSLDDIAGATVIDLFAGSGALGIEALSRGADRANFYDTDPKARAAITANLAATGLADRATVANVDALVAASTPADVAFCDPPYAFDRWPDLLGRLAAPFVVIESDRAVPLPSPWQLVRQRSYGTTVVTFAERRPE